MQRFIENHNHKVYDILVVGGGITGASVAYEAASQGFSVALVEKADFSSATSAATSKLIHGGLRYLANFEFSLVRESLKERRVMLNIAPNLVYPAPFMIPLYNTFARSKWILEPGMIIYDLLSYDKGFTWDKTKKISIHRFLSKEKVLELEPLVNPDGLTGGILFYDCASIFPERLTLAFIKSAVKHGAKVSNYARVEGFLHESGGVGGVMVRDLLNDKTLEIHAKVTINCGGPWADLLLDVARGKSGPQQIRRSEGIHIITKSLTNHFCVGGQTTSGRHCNVIPWRGHSLIGTTDREYIGDPDQWKVTRPKVEEFIHEVNGAFGKEELIKYSDVLFAYGGLRPLVEDETKDVYKSSRKYEIYDNEKDGLKGLVTVEGGKYTTSRNLAQNVMKTVTGKLNLKRQSISSKKYLAGSEIKDMNAFLTQAKSNNSDFEETTIDFLARIYGTEYSEILQIARSNEKYAVKVNSDGEMPAQIVYAIRHEMARTLSDILLRRTGIGTLGYPGDEVLKMIADIAAEELNWSEATKERELFHAKQLYMIPEN